MEVYTHTIEHNEETLTFVNNIRFVANLCGVLGVKSRMEMLENLGRLSGDMGLLADAVDAAFAANGYPVEIAQEISAGDAELLVLQLVLNGKALEVAEEMKGGASKARKKPRTRKAKA